MLNLLIVGLCLRMLCIGGVGVGSGGVFEVGLLGILEGLGVVWTSTRGLMRCQTQTWCSGGGGIEGIWSRHGKIVISCVGSGVFG